VPETDPFTIVSRLEWRSPATVGTLKLPDESSVSIPASIRRAYRRPDLEQFAASLRREDRGSGEAQSVGLARTRSMACRRF